MPRIVEEHPFDGVQEKIARLALASLVNEVKEAIESFSLTIKEQKHANGSAGLRARIDQALANVGDWTNKVSGDVDWIKCKIIDGTRVCIGVEIQISSRSDLIFRDLVHFQKQLRQGQIDVCLLVLPSDKLSYFLTDRTPCMADGKRVVREMRADDLPLLLLAIEHEGIGAAMPKKRTNQGRRKQRSG
jgi:hypothetical protein